MSGSAPHFALAAFVVSLALPSSAAAADLPHGWSVTLTAGANTVTAHAASAAFVLGPGESLHPEIGARGWKASFEGVVAVPQAGAYRFGVAADGGTAEVKVEDSSGKSLGRATTSQGTAGAPATTGFVKLPKGPVVVRVAFARGGQGAARLRTLWEMQPSADGGFRDEPVPSSAVTVPAAQRQAVADALLAVDGRALLERKGCTNCHSAGDAGGLAAGRRQGPVLDRIAERAGRGWLVRWIAAPSAIRPGSDMPDLFAGGGAHPDVAAITAWLGSLAPPPAMPALDAQQLQGRRLFHTIGCANCHGPLAPAAVVFDDPAHASVLPAADAARRPFGDLAGKWLPNTLARFLVDPAHVYPDGRMPSLGLNAGEAEAIASYLQHEFEHARPDADVIALGQRRAQELGCAACHSVGGAPLADPRARPLTELAPTAAPRGCLDPATKTTPRFDLTAAERDALARGIAAVARAKGAPAPLDACAKSRSFLNCSACHSWDGAGGLTSELKEFATLLDERVDLGDEGRVPPDLTSVGFKLDAAWLGDVIHRGARARPYMATRMPRFTSPWATELPAQLAARDGVEPGKDVAAPAASDQAALTGRSLAGQDGMNCISCHVFKDYPPTGSPGPSLSELAHRLRYEWWRSYLQGPSRYKPGTRMPAFSTGRTSTIPDVCGGDIYAQGDALWAWFQLEERMPVPRGLESAAQMKLDVGDRALVVRSFLRHAGPKGIAVGLPVGIHYSVDGQTGRLAEVWEGDFLNATNSWAGRGGMEVVGQGDTVWLAPAGPAIDVDGAEWKFLGYVLDSSGVPTFARAAGDLELREKIVARATPAVVVERRFEVKNAPAAGLVLNAGAGEVEVTQLSDCTAAPDATAGTGKFRITPAAGKTAIGFVLEIRP